MKDDYGSDELYIPNEKCVQQYAAMVRHRIEKMLSVKLMNSLCVEYARRITGAGHQPTLERNIFIKNFFSHSQDSVG